MIRWLIFSAAYDLPEFVHLMEYIRQFLNDGDATAMFFKVVAVAATTQSIIIIHPTMHRFFVEQQTFTIKLVWLKWKKQQKYWKFNWKQKQKC